MNNLQAFVRRAERDAAVIDAVKRAHATIKLIHLAEVKLGDSGIVIDLADDIQRLTAALMLLGYAEGE